MSEQDVTEVTTGESSNLHPEPTTENLQAFFQIADANLEYRAERLMLSFMSAMEAAANGGGCLDKIYFDDANDASAFFEPDTDVPPVVEALEELIAPLLEPLGKKVLIVTDAQEMTTPHKGDRITFIAYISNIEEDEPDSGADD